MPDRGSPTQETRSLAGEKTASPPSLKWGVGRVAFFACLEEIQDEIRQGWPLTVIHARHKEKLRVSYSGFCKLVGRHAAEARSTSSSSPRPLGQPAAPPPAPVEARDDTGRIGVGIPTHPSPELSMEGTPSHTGQQPTQTFTHDPVERPGDYERLLGTRRR
jgi:hypothetical protein